MTRKEDLKILLEYFYYQGKTPIIPKEQVKFILNNLEKDLEVLEILKDKKVNIPYLHSLFEQEDDETIVWYYNLGLEKEEPRMKKITIDDFYKIKEWLENE